MSLPRLRRTVAPTPWARRTSANARNAATAVASPSKPAVGLSGMRVTCAPPAPGHPESRRPPAHGGHHPDGADGDRARRDPDVVVEALDRRPGGVAVRERLAHAHEDHVGDALRARVRGTHHLLHDLGGVEMALEARLAGC